MIIKFETNRTGERIYNSKKRIVLSRGGSSSGKTWGVLMIAVNWLLTGDAGENFPKDESGVFTITRKYATSLSVSVLRDFQNILSKYNLDGFFAYNATRKTYTFGNRVVEFMGVDDVRKIKGLRRRHLYMNESDEFTFDEYTQLTLRTSGRVFIDFNPDDEDCWMNTELEQKRALDIGDVDVMVSTFNDNLAYLDDVIVKEIKSYEVYQPMKWKVYGLGEYGVIKGRIFDDFEIIPDIPEEARFLGYGLDFGFKVSKTALVGIYEWNGGFIWDQVVYQTGLLNSDLDELMIEFGVNKHDLIIADCAEPKTIEELNIWGWHVIACSKGADSVRRRIDVSQSMKMHITARSQDVIREAKKYRWLETPDGRSTKKPVKKDDDLMDAGMYGNEYFFGQSSVSQPNESPGDNYRGTSGLMSKEF